RRSWIMARAASAACGYPRAASALRTVVLPAPGPPVMTKRRLVISLLQSAALTINAHVIYNVILATVSGSFYPGPVSAAAGHYDDEGVIYLRQRVVNVMPSGCRVESQKREGYCRRTLR